MKILNIEFGMMLNRILHKDFEESFSLLKKKVTNISILMGDAENVKVVSIYF